MQPGTIMKIQKKTTQARKFSRLDFQCGFEDNKGPGEEAEVQIP